MVFHIMRADDVKQQDIMALTDIMDPLTGNPSWARFVEILTAGGDLGPVPTPKIGFRFEPEAIQHHCRKIEITSQSLVN